MNNVGKMEDVERALEDRIREIDERKKGGEENVDFICPICGNDTYAHIYHNIILGGQIPRDHCQCDKCSVVFQDPVAFSKKK